MDGELLKICGGNESMRGFHLVEEKRAVLDVPGAEVGEGIRQIMER